METYVDGYVLPVPKNKLEAYKKMAHEAGKVWMKHGALAYYECVGEDLHPHLEAPEGSLPVPDIFKPTTFPQALQTKKNETVIFAFIIYKSRKHRDQVNAKVLRDTSMNPEDCTPENTPFDVQKMAYGGFEPIVSFGKIVK